MLRSGESLESFVLLKADGVQICFVVISRQGRTPALADSYFRDLQARGQGAKSAKTGWSFAQGITMAANFASESQENMQLDDSSRP
jgi:hypothetical protein